MFRDPCFWHYQHARTGAARQWLYQRWFHKDETPLSDGDIQWMLEQEKNRTLILRWEPRALCAPPASGCRAMWGPHVGSPCGVPVWWGAHAGSPCWVPMWGAHVGPPCGIPRWGPHVWGPHVVGSPCCGVPMWWGPHVASPCGVPMWGPHVGCPCGAPTWDAHVGSPCGVPIHVGSPCGVPTWGPVWGPHVCGVSMWGPHVGSPTMWGAHVGPPCGVPTWCPHVVPSCGCHSLHSRTSHATKHRETSRGCKGGAEKISPNRGGAPKRLAFPFESMLDSMEDNYHRLRSKVIHSEEGQ